MAKKPTIQMVADLAGVSRGTVDRVLNNRARVKPEVYDRVVEAIKELNYVSPRESHWERLFQTSYPQIKIGVIYPRQWIHFRNGIDLGLKKAEKELEEFNVSIIEQECLSDEPDDFVVIIDQLVESGINGLALCATNDPVVVAKINQLVEQGIPVVTFNSDVPDSKRLCFVGQDYIKSGLIAGEIMKKLIKEPGNILIVCGNLEFTGHSQRVEGFKRRMTEDKYDESLIHVTESYNDYQLTYRKVREFIENNQLSAVYMANRSVAGCIKALAEKELELSVPVIAHDLSQNTRDYLNSGALDFTISQDLVAQGYVPIITLRNYIHKNEEPEHFYLNGDINIYCSQNI